MEDNEMFFGEPMQPLNEVPDEVINQWAEEEIARQEYFDSLNAELDFEMQLEADNQMSN